MPKGSVKKILVVEDESIVAIDIEEQLKSLGYKIAGIFSKGEEVIAQIESLNPDLILMDIMLAGDLTGVETAEVVRQTFNIPIIYLTAYADEKTLKAAKETAPFGYILKPFEERELHSTIEMGFYRHQLESRLRESRQWFETTLRCLGDAVIATDGNGSVSFINPVAENLTGWETKDAVGKDLAKVFQVVDEASRTPTANPALHALEDRKTPFIPNHTVLISKGGKEYPIESNAAPIRDSLGKTSGSVLVFRDITQRRKAEKQILEYNEKLERQVEERAKQIRLLERQKTENEKLATIGRMTARVAHEINNPLAGIKHAFLLVKDVVPPSSEEFEFVGMIESEINRIADIVRQMLDLYRPEKNLPDQFSVETAIRDVITLLKPSTQKHGVTIESVIDASTPFVNMPEGAFRQVLFNLLQNAIEASSRGGRVFVKNDIDAERLTLEISDAGTGMSTEVQKRLLEPFFTTKDGPELNGLGMGLSITRNLLESVKGSLEFDSAPGRGTRVFVNIPLINLQEN